MCRAAQDVTTEDFQLPSLGPKLAAARDEVCYIQDGAHQAVPAMSSDMIA